MRIVIVSRVVPAHGIGGMQAHAAALAAGLVRAGDEVTILTTAQSASRARQGGRASLGVAGASTSDGAYAIEFLPHTKAARYAGGWWVASATWVRSHRETIDVVLSESTAAAGIHRNVRQRPPTVLVAHGTVGMEVRTRKGRRSPIALYEIIRLRWYGRTHDRDAYGGAAHVIAVSDEVASAVGAEYGVPSHQRTVVPNGIDTERFCPPANRRSADAPFVILSTGRLEREKGIHHLIDALEHLPDHVRLQIIGEGPYREALAAQVKRRGCGDRVDFRGAVESADLPAFYQEASVFALSTERVEGMPLSILEAMACGLPVVAAPAGGIVSVVDEGRTGLLVPPQPQAVAAAVRTLLEDPQRCAAMGVAARARVVEHFSEQQMVERTRAILTRVVESAAPAGA